MKVEVVLLGSTTIDNESLFSDSCSTDTGRSSQKPADTGTGTGTNAEVKIKIKIITHSFLASASGFNIMD
jgi:hypothetical protein